jgi:hypothetical protein
MGASLTMIDCQYGHLARDGREHAAALLDSLAEDEAAAAAWTFGGRRCTLFHLFPRNVLDVGGDVPPLPEWVVEHGHSVARALLWLNMARRSVSKH